MGSPRACRGRRRGEARDRRRPWRGGGEGEWEEGKSLSPIGEVDVQGRWNLDQ